MNDKLMMVMLVAVLICIALSGCSQKMFYYQPVEGEGTTTKMEYENGAPVAYSMPSEGSYVAAAILHQNDGHIIVGIDFWLSSEEGNDTTDRTENVIPRQIILMSDNEMQVPQYSADEWIAKLQRAAEWDMFAIALAGGIDSFSAAYNTQQTNTYSTGSIYAPDGMYYYYGNSTTYTQGIDPVTQQTINARTQDNLVTSNTMNQGRIIVESDMLLRNHTVHKGEIYCGLIHFKSTSSKRLTLQIPFANETHRFIFLKPDI